MLLKNLPPQHPLYGLSHSTIVPVLTQDNWREKAVVRVDRHNPDRCWIFLWVQEVRLLDGLSYTVQCTGTYHDSDTYEATLGTLEAVLSYVNGENPNDSLTLNTRPAIREEWPPESFPHSKISAM